MKGNTSLFTFASISAIVLTVFYSIQLLAGVTTNVPALSDAATKSRGDSIVIATNNTAFENANTQLRCWQEGKLLFEEVNFEKDSFKGSANLIQFKQESKQQALYLMQMGNAVCMFKEK